MKSYIYRLCLFICYILFYYKKILFLHIKIYPVCNSIYKIEQLGFTPDNGLHLLEQRNSWSDLSPRVRHTIDIIEPYAFFCIDEKPFILFFDYSLKSEHDRKKLNIKIWNSQTPVIIIEDDNHIEIKNGFLLDKKKERIIIFSKKREHSSILFWEYCIWENMGVC